MKPLKLFQALLLSVLMASPLFTSCQKDLPDPTPPPQSKVALFVLNEGQFGKTPASINQYLNEKWNRKLFQAANNGKTLGNTGVSTTWYNNNIYIVSKEGCFLSQLNQTDFKEISRIETQKGGVNPLGDGVQARDFCIVDNKMGLLTTSGGAFTVLLQPLALGKKLAGIDADNPVCEDVCRAGDYLFLINKTGDRKQIKVYKAADLSFVKELGEALSGFVQTDETLWAANGSELVKINTKTLAVERLPLGSDVSAYYNKFAYTAASLCISKSKDAIYFVKETVSGWSVLGKEIWKFDIASGKASPMYKPSDEKISVYGSALATHPTTGDIYAIYTEDGYGEHYLKTAIHVIDPKTGKQKEIIPYTKTGETEYWFPTMMVFRNVE